MLLFLRNLLWTILLPGVVAGYVPWRYFGFRFDARVASLPGVVGVILAAFGAAVLIRSILEFALRGRGTLSPVDPPRHLVVSGLYRRVRNPMYVGVVSVLLGEALIIRSWALALYCGAFFAATNIFIMAYEEPYLRARFGASYDEYRRAVGRWIPRLEPWVPTRADATDAVKRQDRKL